MLHNDPVRGHPRLLPWHWQFWPGIVLPCMQLEVGPAVLGDEGVREWSEVLQFGLHLLEFV